MENPNRWTDRDRVAVLSIMEKLTPEQRSQFPKVVQRGDRGFKMTERWLLDEFFGMQPGQESMSSPD